MGELQRVFNAELRNRMDAVTRNALVAKLKKMGVPADTSLVEQMLREGDGEFDIPGWTGGDIRVEFDDEEFKSIQQEIEIITSNVSEVFEETVEFVSSNMLKSFKDNWNKYREYEIPALEGFRDGIEWRWGKALNGLRLLLEISRDDGKNYEARFRRSKSKKNRNLGHALIPLHIRACQVAAEIIVLLENGFPDGAMARWRTLHEITVTATVIVEGGDELARRYLAHEAIEAKQSMDQYIQDHEALGEKPLSKSVMARIRREYDLAISEFEEGFKTKFGWAAGYVEGGTIPNFANLEATADRAAMRSYYKFASLNVHASPRGIASRIGTLDDPTELIAGATNAGLEEPAIHAANTLLQMTSLLLHKPWTLDEIAKMRALIRVRDDVRRALVNAARKLLRDDRSLRRPNTRRALN